MLKITDNLTAWYYDIGTRREFKITYKLPMWSEVKQWWRGLWKKK